MEAAEYEGGEAASASPHHAIGSPPLLDVHSPRAADMLRHVDNRVMATMLMLINGASVAVHSNEAYNQLLPSAEEMSHHATARATIPMLLFITYVCMPC